MLKTIPAHLYLISTRSRLEMVLETLFSKYYNTGLGLGLKARDLEAFRGPVQQFYICSKNLVYSSKKVRNISEFHSHSGFSSEDHSMSLWLISLISYMRSGSPTKADHPRMRAFSYTWSLPVTWQRWGHTNGSYIAENFMLHANFMTLFYRTVVGLIANRSFTLRE